MIQINLLPWREQARRDKQIQFAILIASFIGLAFFAIIFIHICYGRAISHQQDRINFLQSEITQKQADLTALKGQKQEQHDLDAELHFIMNLQTKSFQAVRLLDELASAVPPSVLLDKINREGSTITISGTAQSDSQVTIFMKNIAKSPGLKQPVLTGISAQENSPTLGKHFQLRVEQEG